MKLATLEWLEVKEDKQPKYKANLWFFEERWEFSVWFESWGEKCWRMSFHRPAVRKFAISSNLKYDTAEEAMLEAEKHFGLYLKEKARLLAQKGEEFLLNRMRTGRATEA